ncbi:enolase C-terminal domain-like protein [Nocardioides sp. GXZ039]|uniref:enolase C-terminal domain-like protein n=1 Tax=Nocardioides sp. GXZ039 TaxID=3136018 RepID=UPI0030F4311F
MRIVEVRELSVPLRGQVSNAVVDFSGHEVSLVAVVSDVVRGGRPLTGVAFNSIGRHAQGGILRERLIPRVLAADPGSLQGDDGRIDPTAVLSAMLVGEKPGGHGDRAAAAAAVELACWDLLAKHDQEPAYATIARAHGRREPRVGVPVYAAGGYYRPGEGVPELRAELAGYRERGYPAVKIKIGGLPLADDMARLEAAVEVMGGGQGVAVDANGRFGPDEGLAYGRAMSGLGLRWFEEVGDPLDFDLNRRVAEVYDGAIATGENLFSAPDVQNLLRYGGIRPDRDILQMDAGLSYGLTEYARMISLMEAHGVERTAAFPHGGHLLNLHIVTGLGLGGCEAYPGVFEPFGGYSPDCLLEDGRIQPGDAPGFGLEAKPGLAEEIARLVA